MIVPDEQVLRERGIVNLRELIRFELEGLSVQLPAHKRILSYDISLEPLPRTTTGKIRRHEIERQARERARRPRGGAAARRDDERAWLADAGARATRWRSSRARSSARPCAPDANLELDLGLDSMERVELLTLLEQRHGTRVRAETRATIFTVRQLVDAVPRRRARAAAARVAAPSARTPSLPWDTLLADAARSGARRRPLRDRRPVRAIVLFVAAQGRSRSSRASLLGFRVTRPRAPAAPTARSSSARTTRRTSTAFVPRGRRCPSARSASCSSSARRSTSRRRSCAGWRAPSTSCRSIRTRISSTRCAPAPPACGWGRC